MLQGCLRINAEVLDPGGLVLAWGTGWEAKGAPCMSAGFNSQLSQPLSPEVELLTCEA